MSDKMKTITLRTLVREPLKVKRMTRAGQSVQVTDRGEPLWVLRPIKATAEDEERRKREIEEELAEVLRGPRSKIALSKIVLESRR
jgi:antitoxin (DNA-binding transcriptional repressor) of toxin-antitoxin stability system